MGKRGPAPKPTAPKIASGSRRTLNDGEPIPPAGEIKPPPGRLSKGGLTVWRQLAPVAIAMRVLTTADVEAFARYCNLVAEADALRKWLDKHGSTYQIDGQGYIHEHPKASQYRNRLQELRQLEDRFGLNPSARTRINVMPDSGAPTSSAGSAPLPRDPKRDFFAPAALRIG